jgi:glutaredoxin-like protein NrdH
MAATHVAGHHKGNIILYALSTCPWCRKTKALLNENGVEYDYYDVDQAKGPEREDVIVQVKKYNPALSFPVLVINGKAIIGFKEEEIKEAIKPLSAQS